LTDRLGKTKRKYFRSYFRSITFEFTFEITFSSFSHKKKKEKEKEDFYYKMVRKGNHYQYWIELWKI